MSEQQASQVFLNALDIKNDILYTRDGFMIGYLAISPFNKDLLSERELENKTDMLTSEFSGDKRPWKFLAVSRPVDVVPILNQYQDLLANTSDYIQKQLLREEISVMTGLVHSEDISERQFYMMIWDRQAVGTDADLKKSLDEYVGRFETCGIHAEVLRKPDIIKLCNLINNPAYVLTEDTDTTVLMPYIKGGMS